VKRKYYWSVQPDTVSKTMSLRQRSLFYSALLFVVGLGRLAAQNVQPTQGVQEVPQSTAIPQIGTPPTVARSSSSTDAARYLAGLPVGDNSSLSALTRDPRWQAHAAAMNTAFAQLEQRQLSNIRVWRSDMIPPGGSKTCLYYFSGPDFLYADTFFPDCTTYILGGLESVDPMPDLLTVPQSSLDSTLQNIQISLNTILQFSFFKTKDMREDFQRGQLKGVLPIIFVFLARTGKDISAVDYVSLTSSGTVVSGNQGATHGLKINFSDPASGAEKVLYFFTADLSDDGAKKNAGVLRFVEQFAPTNSFLKAASYLMHEGHFTTIRSSILNVSSLILEDDSGIPVRYFAPDKWTLRFSGAYSGPIELFKNFYQSDLRQYYQASSPKTLTFSFGYQWNRHNSTLILAVRK
jgi:hypothetical protein